MHDLNGQAVILSVFFMKQVGFYPVIYYKFKQAYLTYPFSAHPIFHLASIRQARKTR